MLFSDDSDLMRVQPSVFEHGVASFEELHEVAGWLSDAGCRLAATQGAGRAHEGRAGQRTQARGYVNVLTLAPDGRRLGTRIENR